MTSFFSKNMIVILCIALVITHILKTTNYEGMESTAALSSTADSSSPIDTTTETKKEAKAVSKETKAVTKDVTKDEAKAKKNIYRIAFNWCGFINCARRNS